MLASATGDAYYTVLPLETGTVQALGNKAVEQGRCKFLKEVAKTFLKLCLTFFLDVTILHRSRK